MAEDWAADVKKYAPDADDNVIAGIVRYCGIALRSRDASLVSFSDPVETARVRDNFCRKKLGLTEPDADVDAAIARVGTRMGGDRTRNRVTVYYLLAEAFGKLGLFRGKTASSATAGAAASVPLATAAAAEPVATSMPAPPPAAATSMPAPQTAAATPPRATAAPRFVAAAPAMAAAPAAARPLDGEKAGGGIGSTALIAAGVMGAIILGTAMLGSQIAMRIGGRTGEAPPPAASPPDFSGTTTTTAAAPAVPVGAGVVAQEKAGRPEVSVYFDSGKSDIAPGFATAAAPIKAWLDGHDGARLAVSGFNDPTGGAAANAELSKNRAKAVAAALASLGIPAALIDLEKPPETTDTGASAAAARRVDIVVKDAS